MSEELTQFQREALAVYSDGEFKHITQYDYTEDHGDSLLTFILAELSDNEDCEDRETAIMRINRGIEDLKNIQLALLANWGA